MAYSFQMKLLRALALGVGVSCLSYLYYRYSKRQEKVEVIPNHWRQVGTLDCINFFPIKSCAPIELDKALCENLGIREGDIKDRALMIIDKDGKLVTARVYPRMVLIHASIIGPTQLVISARGMADINFDYTKIPDKTVKANIFDQTVMVKDCGKEYNTWFSTYILGEPEGVRLVYYPHDEPTRPIDNVFKNGIFSKKDTGSLHDVSSYHLINRASVKDLNSRLKNKVMPVQFRSNFYVNAYTPYVEDNWEWIRIGCQATFRNISPCYRCIMPNINPYTAQRDPDGQPLKILNTYRIDANAPVKAPIMGSQLGLRAVGTVKIGDPVFINHTE